MNGSALGPDKPKKKKRSFLDEDDFFNMKKARPQSPPKLATPNIEPSTIKPEISSGPKHELGSISAGNLSDDENVADFHSANASFADANHVSSPVALAHNSGNGSTTHDFNSTTGGAHLGETSSSENVARGDVLSSDFSVNSASKQVTESPLTSQPIMGTNPVPVLNTAPDKNTVVDIDDDDDDDDEDGDLKEFFSGLAKKKKADSGDEYESGRLYSVKVTSRLGRPFECEKQITGETTFAELVEVMSRDTLREFKDANYWKHGVLVWIEGKSELKPIFKPKTLRIPEPIAGTPTKLSCLYIPPSHVTNFETLYPEFSQVSLEESEVNEDAEDLVVLLGDLEKNSGAGEGEDKGGEGKAEEDKSEFFVIGLKGKDNKRIEAEVGPSTKIRSVLNYYMQAKGITAEPGREGRILFEDEELDLDAVVGDTELEEDFEVQVYI